jgi:hypothetical protein
VNLKLQLRAHGCWYAFRSHGTVTLHSWHEVLVSRTGRFAWLQVDTQSPSHAATPGAFTQLLLPQSMYLGGVPNLDIVSPKTKARSSFVGCIQKVSPRLIYLGTKFVVGYGAR